MIHRLVGITCETIGMAPLSSTRANLGSRTGPPGYCGVGTNDRDTPAWGEVLQDESRFARSEPRQPLNPFKRLANWWEARIPKRTRRTGITEPWHVCACSPRNWPCVLSCPSKAACPRGWMSWSPRYLQRVPQDPFSGKPLIFVPQGTHWLLYSVGPDRVDDGGSQSAKTATLATCSWTHPGGKPRRLFFALAAGRFCSIYGAHW